MAWIIHICHDFINVGFASCDAGWYAKYVDKQQERAGIGAWRRPLWED